MPESEFEANIKNFRKKIIKSNIKRKKFINEDMNNISDKNIDKKKGLQKSPSIFSLLCSPNNGKKLKLEKKNTLNFNIYFFHIYLHLINNIKMIYAQLKNKIILFHV